MTRTLYRVRVEATWSSGAAEEYVDYVWADTEDQAAREAEANAEEDMPGADVWADPERITEARIVNGKVQA